MLIKFRKDAWKTHHEVGDCVYNRGHVYYVVPAPDGCQGCAFLKLSNYGGACCKPKRGVGACYASQRKDKRDVVFIMEQLTDLEPDMNRYSDSIYRAASERSSEIIGNFSVAGAWVAISRLWREAKYSVSIMAYSCYDIFYGSDIMTRSSLLKNAMDLKRPGAIRIITLSGTDGCALKEMIREVNKTVGVDVIRYIPAKLSNASASNTFMVFDDCMYRLTDPLDVSIEYGVPKAEVCFNDPEKAAGLLSTFNETWEKLNKGESDGDKRPDIN